MANPENSEEIVLDKNNPDSIYNWVAIKISSPSFRNIIKDFIDDNCSLFIDIEENTFEQGQLFNEFNQLLENILGDVLAEGGLTQDQFLAAAQRGLEDPKYRKYFDQLLNFGDYNFFKRIMTKRNYTLIKRFEEQISQKRQLKEEQEKEEQRKKEEEERKRIEEEKEKEKEKEKNKGKEKKEMTEKEKEDEKQRILLYQLLNQEEEKELQEVIKQSLEMEEEKRRIAVIEEEELNRALKRSLLDSVRPTNIQEEPKKEEQKKEEPKKETKKPIFQIQKNDNFNFENQEKEKEKEEKKSIPPPKKNNEFSIMNNDLFQYSGSFPKEEEKKDKPVNIISANKGFEFQIESAKNNFGISSENQINIPEDKKEDLIDREDKNKNIQKKDKKDPEYKDIEIKENKKIEYDKVEIKRKKEDIQEKKPIIFNDDKNKGNKNNDNKPKIEESIKEENIIIANEIKTKPISKPIVQEEQEQKASDIIKQSLNDNKNDIKINENNEENNDNGGYDRLLISDDDDDEKEEEKQKNEKIESKPITNAFIDKKKDINLAKVKVGKDGGNFFNNYGGMKNYEKGGIEKLETKIKEQRLQSVVSNPNEEDDYLAKLREVEKEKNQKLKEYREKLTKMQKEKRENKAKQTLSPEELAKLQRREQLAEKLKAKRKDNK